MKKLQLSDKLSRSLYKTGFKIKKHSPTILVVAGVVGVVASTVMACRATLKVNDILEESKETIDKIHTCMEDQELKESGRYTEKDGKKDLTATYIGTGFKIVKLYAPSVIVGTVSIVGIVASYKILNKRNLALSAAYTAIDKSFKDYRKRVKERFGDVVEGELRHNIKAKTVETLVVDENGNEKTETKTIQVSGNNEPSDYAKWFDDSSEYWTNDSSYNVMFLRQVERTATRKLVEQGILSLNEVYRMLGLKPTRAGQEVGWVYDEKNPVGDNKVSFNIFEISNELKRDFVNGWQPYILLDFNVDGYILDLLP